MATIQSSTPHEGVNALRWPSVLAMVSAAGLLVVAVADNLARQDAAAVAGFPADLAFWLGIILITVPSGFRLLSRAVSRAERILLLLMVGVALYLVKVLHDPTLFTFFDEFLHVRSVDDILRTGRLFVTNGMLPVSPSFPGLESATAAIVSTSGSSTFFAGTVLLGVARVLLVLSLFLFYTKLGASERIASIATFIYMANPNFLFFTSQFAYESLALPLACFSLYAVARRQAGVDSRRVSWIVVGLAISATVVTHHVTSIALFSFLALWSVVAFIMRWRSREKEAPLMPALLAGGATYVWLLLVAGIVVGYLGPAIQAAATQVAQLFRGGSARELFSATGAPRLPAWEQMLAYAAIGLLLAGTMWGLWRLWRTGNLTPPIVAIGLGALAYPASLVARLTVQGVGLSDRASAFVFLAVGLVVAAGLENRQWAPPSLTKPSVSVGPEDLATSPSRPWRLLVPGVVLAIIMLGGVALSFPVWARMPGSYLVSADPRSIEPQGILAGEWTLRYLGRDNRFLVDRTNRLLVGTFGAQHPVTASFDQVRVRTAYFSLEFGEEEIEVLTAGKIDYVLIDRRLSTSLPVVGVYYEKGEIATGGHTAPISPVALAKFDGVPLVARLFDSGDIQIYDVRSLTDVPTQ